MRRGRPTELPWKDVAKRAAEVLVHESGLLSVSTGQFAIEMGISHLQASYALAVMRGARDAGLLKP